MRTEKLNIRVPADLYAHLMREAAAQGFTLSAYSAGLLARAINADRSDRLGALVERLEALAAAMASAGLPPSGRADPLESTTTEPHAAPSTEAFRIEVLMILRETLLREAGAPLAVSVAEAIRSHCGPRRRWGF